VELLTKLRQSCCHPYLVIKSFCANNKIDTQLFHTLLEAKGKMFDKFFGDIPETLKTIHQKKCSKCGTKVFEPLKITNCSHLYCASCISKLEVMEGLYKCCKCNNFSPVKEPKHKLLIPPSMSTHFVLSTKLTALRKELLKLKKNHPTTKCLVFSQWTSFLDIIEDALDNISIAYLRIDGSTPGWVKREMIKEEFFQNPETNVLLISMRAGGIGLNLEAANVAFLMDPWWNPAVEDQAINRIHRIGQEKDVLIKKFIVKDTVEEAVVKLQEGKNYMCKPITFTSKEELRNWQVRELKVMLDQGKLHLAAEIKKRKRNDIPGPNKKIRITKK